MRLTSIVIVEHFLFEGPQVINLGGRFSFNLTSIKSNEIHLNKSENIDFIENLYNDKISLVSSIVGANGSGKTTLFWIIDQIKDETKTIFIYETKRNKKWEFLIKNRTGNRDENGNLTETEAKQIFIDEIRYDSNVRTNDVQTLYYSPIADYDLKDISSSISKTTHFKSTLFDYYFDNVERNVLFLGSDIIPKLKNLYPDIPLYNSLEIRAKRLSKRDLRNSYGGFRVEGEVETAQRIILDQLWDSYPLKDAKNNHLTNDNNHFIKNIEVNILSYLIIDGTSIQTLFNGDYEVSFETVVKEKDFLTKLAHFFHRKAAYIDKYIYSIIKSSIERKNYTNLLRMIKGISPDEGLDLRKEEVDQLLNEVRIRVNGHDDKFDLIEHILGLIKRMIAEFSEEKEFNNISLNLKKIQSKYRNYREIDNLKNDFLQDLNRIENGISDEFKWLRKEREGSFPLVVESFNSAINLFVNILNFYSFITTIKTVEGSNLDKGTLIFNLRKVKFEIFQTLVSKYRNLIKSFRGNSALSNAQILEFKPDKRLSFGEKSLLDFFSSLYDFTISDRNHIRQKEKYLLLLDETDLGFHPLWKKRFINSITSITPHIFSKLEPKVFDEKQKKLVNSKSKSPDLQIILSTHDPLTLSDIPNQNITYLYKKENGKSVVLGLKEQARPTKSFGANIADLLSDSFFVEEKGGLVGDFSRNTINKTIEWLTTVRDKQNAKYHKGIIKIIDEPIVQRKLAEMYSEKMKDDFSREIFKSQIDKLQSEFDSKYPSKK